MNRAENLVRQLAAELGPVAPDTALFIASSSFQIGHFESPSTADNLPVAAGSFGQTLADWLGLSGPLTNVSNACISGFSAIEAASTLIAAGLIDEAVVLGIELANDTTLAGFAAMELLSRSQARPFAADRNGLVLGEAVAALRLTAHPTSWRIAAVGTGIDGYSTTGPDPEGGPIADLIGQTLATASLTAADIDLIKMQAAGSPGTDLAEARALRRVFGDTPPPLITLKPALGHTLGASGIAETVALLACLDAGHLPAQSRVATPDVEISLNFAVDREIASVKTVLLNLIGFGGGLASLIVERAS